MRRVISTLMASVVAISFLAGANAQTTGTATVNVTSSGQRTVAIGNANFGPISYSFQDQDVNTPIVVTVTDNSGSGAGRNVTIFGEDFDRPDGRSFDIANLGLDTGVAESTAGQPATGVTAPGGTVTESSPGTTIASAPALQGMGAYTISYPATLTVPGGTLVGEYQSTLTVSIATGP